MTKAFCAAGDSNGLNPWAGRLVHSLFDRRS
jgi:hypothetical protein